MFTCHFDELFWFCGDFFLITIKLDKRRKSGTKVKKAAFHKAVILTPVRCMQGTMGQDEVVRRDLTSSRNCLHLVIFGV